uniref:Uncharacterized protein n=1 Tax=Timema monikensis TaxID=170555 RepID=A0A7R9EGD8_9NEOP|nr:unnamed protein product [Timema monikensis]
MRNSTNEDRPNGLHVHTSRGVSYEPMWENGEDEVLNELSMKPRKINMRLKLFEGGWDCLDVSQVKILVLMNF